MSASHEWTEWHLTPDGWVRGSQLVDFAGKTDVPPPENRVFTCKYDEYLGSSFGKMHQTINDCWESDDKEVVRNLLEKYGPCPEQL